MRYWLAIFCVAIHGVCFCQTTKDANADSSTVSQLQAIENIPSKSLDYIDKKYNQLGNTVQTQSEKLLQRMQQKEAKLRKKLAATDSLKAKQLFEASEAKYAELQGKITAPINTATAKLKEYIPGLDSTNTALKFLSQSTSGLPTDKIAQLSSVTNSVQELQGRLQQANEVQAFVREREAQLKEALANTGLGKELLGINKEVYYYQERLREYKELLNDKKKMEEKLLSAVRELPVFQKFMEQHSYLSMLFPAPANYDATRTLSGIQTRANVQSMLGERFGTATNGTNPQGYIQQQMQAAQSQLNTLKDKISSLGCSQGDGDMTMPDFKPNTQKTKSFLQRIEYGINVQSTRSNSFLPATSDIAFTAGYKANDKLSFGTGISYKLGWGEGWNHIKLSSQGIGLRSYVDIKAKGSIWISGGFEYNYMQAFAKIDELKNLDVWQRSALAGLTKKITVGKKASKVQLLYDFLASKQVPAMQALKFRIGLNF